MIRDEFKNEVKTTSKEYRKKQQMGERQFYITHINKIQDLMKAIKFSSLFTLIVYTVFYAMVALVYFLSLGTEEPYSVTKFIIFSAIFAVLLIAYLVFIFIIKPAQLRKVERYKQELSHLSKDRMNRIADSYKVYGEEYMNKLIEERRRKSEEALEVSRKKHEQDMANTENTEPASDQEVGEPDNSETEKRE